MQFYSRAGVKQKGWGRAGAIRLAIMVTIGLAIKVAIITEVRGSSPAAAEGLIDLTM